MRDTELYRHLLGLVAPWEVERVELSVEDGRVEVWVQHQCQASRREHQSMGGPRSRGCRGPSGPGLSGGPLSVGGSTSRSRLVSRAGALLHFATTSPCRSDRSATVAMATRQTSWGSLRSARMNDGPEPVTQLHT
jgi:hypothetical protein